MTQAWPEPHGQLKKGAVTQGASGPRLWLEALGRGALLILGLPGCGMKARSFRDATRQSLPGSRVSTEKAELSPRIQRAWIQSNLKVVP